MANNADILVTSIRQLQEYVFDKNASPNSIFVKLEQFIGQANKASKQINMMEEQMTRTINALSKKGVFNNEVVSAFTGLDEENVSKLLSVIGTDDS